jgi:cell division inhibitor SepF
MKEFVGMGDVNADYEENYGTTSEVYSQSLYASEEALPTEEDQQTNRRSSARRFSTDTFAGMGTPMSNVIGMPRPANGVPEVVIVEPHSFEEMPQAIQALRERKSVILNLNLMDLEQAQRAVDFVAGGTYAIDGHQERIGESIFLFTPNCVQVSTQSGVNHEAPQPQPRVTRPQTSPAPAPAWEPPQKTTMTA